MQVKTARMIFAGKQAAREAALKEQMELVVSRKKVVMLPVVYEHHWTLVVIHGREQRSI